MRSMWVICRVVLLIGVDVLGTGVSWKVEATTNPSGFLAFPGTVTASNGSSAASSAGADGAVLTIVYGQNNGPERKAILTFEAVDKDGNSYTPAATHKITITQLGALPTLLVTQTGMDSLIGSCYGSLCECGSNVCCDDWRRCGKLERFCDKESGRIFDG